MRPVVLLRLLLLACGLQAGTASGAERVRLYVSSAPEQEVQMGMGRDMARLIARDAEIDLDVRGVAGTPEALLELAGGHAALGVELAALGYPALGEADHDPAKQA